MLVLDVTDDLFKYILHCNQPKNSTGFLTHDGKRAALSTEQVQSIGHVIVRLQE